MDTRVYERTIDARNESFNPRAGVNAYLGVGYRPGSIVQLLLKGEQPLNSYEGAEVGVRKLSKRRRHRRSRRHHNGGAR